MWIKFNRCKNVEKIRIERDQNWHVDKQRQEQTTTVYDDDDKDDDDKDDDDEDINDNN